MPAAKGSARTPVGPKGNKALLADFCSLMFLQTLLGINCSVFSFWCRYKGGFVIGEEAQCYHIPEVKDIAVQCSAVYWSAFSA